VRSPYYKKPLYENSEDLIKSINRYFEIVDSVDSFTLTGGEPTLHKELHRLIDCLAEYADKIGILDIITNGTNILSDAVLTSLKNYPGKIKLLIDHYGNTLSKSAEELTLQMKNAFPAAIVDLRDYHSDNSHFGGWVDFNTVMKNRSDAEAQTIYENCAVAQSVSCKVLCNKIIYACGQTRIAVEKELIPAETPNAVNLFDNNLTDDEIRQRLSGIYNVRFLEACKYCDGLLKNSVRYKAAEQLQS
jgi:uncharacterized radical SAM superfamily Fe-S cluster-containing enzyme